MPPKQAQPPKRLNKQELKALRKEKKEKRKEEARQLAEEKKRLADEEAKRMEEEARLAWEAEQARLQAEHDRILNEKEQLSSFFKGRSETLANLDITLTSLVDWSRYVDAGELPYANDEGAMNNFFGALEASYDLDYSATLSTVKNIFKVFLSTEELALIEQQKGNLKLAERFRSYMKNLEKLLQVRIDQTTSYLLEGGLFVLDILAVPPVSRSSKSWTFEHVTLMTNSVVRLAYPLPVGGSGSGPTSVTPAIGLEFPIPTTVIVSGNPPEIGWWDEEEVCWKKDGISDIEYEETSRKVKFQTIRAKPHAMIQSRIRHYPYKSWILSPISENKALFTLHGRVTTIKVEVGSGWCKLVEIPHSECKQLVGQEMAPIILLKKLSRCGLHLMPVDSDGQFLEGSIKL